MKKKLLYDIFKSGADTYEELMKDASEVLRKYGPCNDKANEYMEACIEHKMADGFYKAYKKYKKAKKK